MFSTRQLAAIMFTDIVGYTALMGSDESKAMDFVRRNKDIQKPLVEKYGETFRIYIFRVFLHFFQYRIWNIQLI